MMERISQLSRLVTVFLLFCFVAATVSSSPSPTATTTATSQMRRPGYFYSRTRGRCTPQFWSSRREAWPRMVPQTSTLSKIFGSRVYERYRYDLTLLESTDRSDDGNPFAGLVKEATAALLNSYARKGFPYTAWEVKSLLIEALVSEEAAAHQARKFSDANQIAEDVREIPDGKPVMMGR